MQNLMGRRSDFSWSRASMELFVLNIMPLQKLFSNTDRTIYLNTYPGMSGAPDITNISSSPTSLAIGDSVWITAKISNADSAILAYRFTSTDLFTKVDMLDDGNNGVTAVLAELDCTYAWDLSGSIAK